MAHINLEPLPTPISASERSNTLSILAVCLGIVMPVVAAIAFPTYMHQMPHPGWEWARLLELPFVFFEIGVIMWATHSGCNRADLWKVLPRDIRVSSLVLVAAMLASSIVLSQSVAAALTMSLIWVVHGLFAIAVYQLVSRERGAISESFLDWHAAGLVVLALYTAWWFLFPPPAETVMGGVIEWGSALPGFINVRHFGAWTGAIAAGLAVKILFAPRSRKWNVDDLFYTLAAAMTVWSATRAAILAIMFAVPLMSVMLWRLPPLSLIARAAFLTILAVAAAWVFRWPDPTFVLISFEEYKSVESAGSGRVDLWAKGIELWTHSPLLGWGTGSFFWEGKPWSHTQPHNVIVQFLVSWGLIGAVAGLWLVGRGIVAVHRAGISSASALPVLGIMNALLFQSLLEGMLHYPRFIISIIVCGIAVMVLAPREAAGAKAF